MKILFVAPRFHTNQYQITKYLKEAGHNVEFFVNYIGKSEDHSIIKPYLIKKTYFSVLAHKLIDYKYPNKILEDKKMKYFIPSMPDLFKSIKTYKPDVIILRERNFTSMCAYFICKVLKLKFTIIYNQTPLYTFYESEGDFKNSPKKCIKKHCFPKVRITPVLTKNVSESKNNQDKYYIKEHDYFVPFIAETNEKTATREYCSNEIINILDVGKYRDYKNHFLLVNAIEILKDCSHLNVTIVGQVINEEEEKYFESLKTYIKLKKLENVIQLRKNIEYADMLKTYQSNDIFILTSKKELASISVLEAMANGLVTISTDFNGTASYIKEGECGYYFKTMDAADLACKIEKVISDKSNIEKMGRNAYRNIKENYSFNNYHASLAKVIKNEFGSVL